MSPTATLVAVGGGPRTLGLLLRLGANAPELAADLRLDIHVVDPFPPGGGRIWRRRQSPLLWMNSLAEDVTVFTDSSVECAGPIDGGPSLAQWAAAEAEDGSAGFAAAVPDRENPASTGSFAPRSVQAQYLEFAWERAVDALPDGFTVTVHRTRAVDLQDAPAHAGHAQRVRLENGTTLLADVVVLAQGYLEQRPSQQERAWQAAALERGLTYVPTGHTADLDLTGLRPGEPVLVRGMGLAFVDLFVLLGEGRGGRFVASADGGLDYEPSGQEPILHVGSGRGVPYHAKLGYDVGATGPVALRHLTHDAVPAHGPLDWDTQVWPLVERELLDLHYRHLFATHPERTAGPWEPLESAIAEHRPGNPRVQRLAVDLVPDPADRFVVDEVDQPLRRLSRSGESVEQAVVAHIEGDLARRADPRFSSDRAVFDGLLSIYGTLGAWVQSGRLSAVDRVVRFERRFHGFFSFIASGPPPRRLQELLALHRAGIVRFLGPDLSVELGTDCFRARGRGVRPVRARALVDARLPHVDVRRVADPLIAGLVERDELHVDTVHDPATGSAIAGRLVADERGRAVRSGGVSHPRRVLLGPAVAGSVGSAGFVRPGHNGPSLRQNDAVARDLLQQLAGRGEHPAAATPDHDRPHDLAQPRKEHLHAS